MSYRRTTDATIEPLTLDEAKAWLRVTDTIENGLIETLIKGVRQLAERRTSRAFLSQTWELVLDEWPGSSEIQLPVAPLIAVSSVSYEDANGDTQILSSANYEVDVVKEPGRLVLKPAESWPSLEDGINKVTITFTAGYGTKASSVPSDLKTALCYLLSEHFVDRREISFGNPKRIPDRAFDILWKYRLFPK